MVALVLALLAAAAVTGALVCLRWWAAQALEDPSFDVFDLPLVSVPAQRVAAFADVLPRLGAHERYLVDTAGSGLRELEEYLASGGAH